MPEIGDELAVGRALGNLSERLLHPPSGTSRA
ncbi:dsRBD fold-containing protein [Agromyces flavus]